MMDATSFAPPLIRSASCFALIFLLALATAPATTAQESTSPGDADTSSRQVEETEEAYRRRMELEDARSREAGYADTTYSQKVEEQKLDELPQASRENIRDQLVDVIMENGEWEPSDALADYPYDPSEAAASDAELARKEQEAWDEQIEKYHQREAEAFGATRPPPGGAPGVPGAPDGEGEGAGKDGEPSNGTTAGEAAEAAAAAGSFQPYESDRREAEDAISTAGVSESALDFIRAGRAGGDSPPADQPAGTAAAPQAGAAEAEAAAEAATEARIEARIETPGGILPIEDLGGLRGVNEAERSEAPEQDTADGQDQTESNQQAAAAAAQESGEDSAQQSEAEQQFLEIDLQTPGILPIRDLEKLEGTRPADAPPDG